MGLSRPAMSLRSALVPLSGGQTNATNDPRGMSIVKGPARDSSPAAVWTVAQASFA